MKIAEINYGFRGSTGNIMRTIAGMVREQGGEAVTFSAPQKGIPPEGHRYFGTKAENLIHRCVSVFTGISGTGSVLGTKALLAELEAFQPDILHLHNLHGWFINLPMLFDFIRRHNIKTVWTLHDCWGFTAQCSHFSMEKCEKWKIGCYNCPRYRIYPYTYVDRTGKMWKLKKKWFSGVKDLTIVTPSQWLADLVKQSFLQEYPVQVIHNGIDLSVFQPTENDFRRKHNIPEDAYILLGVASGWNDRKGLDVFAELAKRLDAKDYQVVLVGTDEQIDRELPENILSIHRTENQQELARIYTAADLFINPTREETYPTVNMEALACGTPIVTFPTGGSPEIPDETCGLVIPLEDTDGLVAAIQRLCTQSSFSQEACLIRSSTFRSIDRFQEYISLFHQII